MSTCTKCGNVGKPGEKFCLVCGNPYPAEAPVQQGMPGMAPMGQPMQNYGAPMGQPGQNYGSPMGNPGQNYGMPMGQPMQYYGAPMGQQPNNSKPASPKKINKGLIIGIASAVAVIAVVVVLFLSGVLGKSTTIEDSLENFCNGLAEGDEDLFNKAFDDGFLELLDGYMEARDYFTTQEMYDGEDSFHGLLLKNIEFYDIGDIEEVTYKIKDEDKVDDAEEAVNIIMDGFTPDEIEEDLEEWEEDDYIDDDDIEAGQKLLDAMRNYEESLEDAKEFKLITVNVKIKGEDGKDGDTVKFVAVRRSKGWKLAPVDLIVDF